MGVNESGEKRELLSKSWEDGPIGDEEI